MLASLCLKDRIRQVRTSFIWMRWLSKIWRVSRGAHIVNVFMVYVIHTSLIVPYAFSLSLGNFKNVDRGLGSMLWWYWSLLLSCPGRWYLMVSLNGFQVIDSNPSKKHFSCCWANVCILFVILNSHFERNRDSLHQLLSCPVFAFRLSIFRGTNWSIHEASKV